MENLPEIKCSKYHTKSIGVNTEEEYRSKSCCNVCQQCQGMVNGYPIPRSIHSLFSGIQGPPVGGMLPGLFQQLIPLPFTFYPIYIPVISSSCQCTTQLATKSTQSDILAEEIAPTIKPDRNQPECLILNPSVTDDEYEEDGSSNDQYLTDVKTRTKLNKSPPSSAIPSTRPIVPFGPPPAADKQTVMCMLNMLTGRHTKDPSQVPNVDLFNKMLRPDKTHMHRIPSSDDFTLSNH